MNMDQGKGVHRIDTRASDVYIVVNGSSSLLVDAGRKGGSEKILKMMERNGSDPSDIKVIFLPHTHIDHTGSLKTLKKETGADVIVH